MSSGFARRVILLCFVSQTHAQQSLTPPTSHPPVCTETCTYHGDGDCDDGGHGHDYTLCQYGSDCHDCGERPYYCRVGELWVPYDDERCAGSGDGGGGWVQTVVWLVIVIACSCPNLWGELCKFVIGCCVHMGERATAAARAAGDGAARARARAAERRERENYERRMRRRMANLQRERARVAILANAMSTNYETRSQRLNALLGALGSVLPTLSREQRRGLLLRAGGDAKLAAALATGEFGAPRRVAATPVAGSVTGLVVTGRKLLSAVVRRVAPAAAPPAPEPPVTPPPAPVPPLARLRSFVGSGPSDGLLSNLLVRHDGNVSAAANAYFEDRAAAEAAPAPSSRRAPLLTDGQREDRVDDLRDRLLAAGRALSSADMRAMLERVDFDVDEAMRGGAPAASSSEGSIRELL